MISAIWRFELLGGFCLRRGDEEVTHFRTRRAASLIVYLALNPERHSRDALIDRFWPDAEYDAARASFRVTLSHIRKELGADFLQTTRDSVGIAAPFTCDVPEFERAVTAKRWEDAARLYRGELLPGFWSDWIVSERERLEAIFTIVRENTGTKKGSVSVFLPEEPNRFFGREEEIARIARLLDEDRLVSLLGMGGVGKTRLAIAAARRHAALFPGGVWFVSLADLREADRFLLTIRDALGLPRAPLADPGSQIAEFLRGDSRCLLILDNFEQIAAVGAPILSSLLACVPNLSCLVTTRRRLGIPEERQIAVAPLGEGESISLFCDRSQTAQEAETVDLCRDLEGVPLAIELCAARAGVFSIAEMRAKLAEPLRMLWSSDADKNSRHRSLFAAIEWSYRLLTPEQRRFFARLSVFRGGWNREAAESVCDEPGATEYIAQLRERSFLVVEQTDGAIRFRMLDSIRSFARERLAPEDQILFHKRHGDYFHSFAAKCHGRLDGAETGRVLDRMEADHDNFRVALERADVPERLLLITELWKFWEIRGHFDEGRRRITAALADSSERDDTRAQVLSALGALAYAQGDHEAALSAQDEAVGIARDPSVAAKARNNRALTLMRMGRLSEAEQSFREVRDFFAASGNRTGESATLSNLGIIRRRLGDFDGARSVLEAAVRINRADDNRQSLAISLNGLALVCVRTGKRDEAERHFSESLAIKRALNDRAGVVSALANLGTLATEQGIFDRALSLQSEALTLRIELGLQHGILESLSGFAQLAHATGAPHRAATLVGAQVALGTKLGSPVPPEEIADTEAALLATLGPDTYHREFTRGALMTVSKATEYALNQGG